MECTLLLSSGGLWRFSLCVCNQGTTCSELESGWIYEGYLLTEESDYWSITNEAVTVAETLFFACSEVECPVQWLIECTRESDPGLWALAGQKENIETKTVTFFLPWLFFFFTASNIHSIHHNEVTLLAFVVCTVHYLFLRSIHHELIYYILWLDSVA